MAPKLSLLTAAILASRNAGPPSLNSPTFVFVGDSITQFGNLKVALSSVTVTRQSDGTLSATAAANTMYGQPKGRFCNVGDQTMEAVGRNNHNATTPVAGSGAIVMPAAGFASPVASAGTSTTNTNGAWINFERFSQRGIAANLQSLFLGGMQFLGNIGDGGAMVTGSPGMTQQMEIALAMSPQIVVFMGGVNDLNGGGQTAAATFAAAQTLAKRATGLDGGSGNSFFIWCATMPVASNISSFSTKNLNLIGDPNSATVTTSYNALAKAYCAANPTKMIFVDTFNPVCDKTTDPANWRFYDATSTGFAAMTASTDGLHPLSNAGAVLGNAVYTAVNGFITTPTLLPTSSSDTGTVNGHTRLVLTGPWGTVASATATPGTYASGGSNDASPASGTGALPTGWVAGRSLGSGTIKCSTFDPGDGKGLKVRAVAQAVAAADTVILWPYGNGGKSLAALGVSVGDEIAFACELEWGGAISTGSTYTANATQAGVGLIGLMIQSNSSGAFGWAGTAEEREDTAGGFLDAAANRTYVTGWLYCDSNVTTLVPQIQIRFNSGTPTGVPIELHVRRVVLMKK